MPMPNFLIIGAMKAGTSSLYSYCHQHPEIFMPSNKEPRFFAFENEIVPDNPALKGTVTDLETYKQLFEGVQNEKAIGEASPTYLSHPRAPERIKHYIPDAKLVAVLRHPAERAYSHFLHSVQKGLEPLNATFEEAISTPSVKVGRYVRHRSYVSMGFYAQQLQRYFQLFDKDQIRIYLFEDFRNDPVRLAREIYTFLEVDPTFVPRDLESYMQTGIPRSPLLERLLMPKDNRFVQAARSLVPDRVRKRLWNLRVDLTNRNLQKPPLSKATKARLTKGYKDDILHLQTLIGRDLRHWLEV